MWEKNSLLERIKVTKVIDVIDSKCDRHLWYDCSWWPKALYVFVMARPKLRALRQMPMTTRICENVIFSPENFKEFLNGSYVEIMLRRHTMKDEK